MSRPLFEEQIVERDLFIPVKPPPPARRAEPRHPAGHDEGWFHEHEQEPEPAGPGPFKLWSYEELKRQPAPKWLVTDFMRERITAVMFGRGGSLKSFVALDLALSIATGRPWRDHPVEQGPVLYIALEGKDQIAPRVDGWLRTAGISDPGPIRFITDPYKPLHHDVHQRTLDTVAEWGVTPHIVFIDTLARATAGTDENSTADMGQLTEAIDRLRDDLETAVVLVHHNNKANGFRGSSRFRDDYDMAIPCQRDGTNPTVTLMKGDDAKNKSAPETPITLPFQRVDTGLAEEDGTPITTLAPATLDLPETPRTREIMTELLHTLLTDHNGQSTRELDMADRPPQISRELWRNYLKDILDNPPPNVTTKPTPNGQGTTYHLTHGTPLPL